MWQAPAVNKTLFFICPARFEKDYTKIDLFKYLSPFWTTRFLQVLQQEQAWLHSNSTGVSQWQKSNGSRPSCRHTHKRKNIIVKRQRKQQNRTRQLFLHLCVCVRVCVYLHCHTNIEGWAGHRCSCWMSSRLYSCSALKHNRKKSAYSCSIVQLWGL